MKRSALLITLLACLATSCAIGNKEAKKDNPAKNSVRLEQPAIRSDATNQSKTAIEQEKNSASVPVLDTSVSGKVLTFNRAGRFVVLDFPVGKMPALDATMLVYRGGKKIGEVKITGPTRDNSTVADLVSGEATKGDEVRER